MELIGLIASLGFLVFLYCALRHYIKHLSKPEVIDKKIKKLKNKVKRKNKGV